MDDIEEYNKRVFNEATEFVPSTATNVLSLDPIINIMDAMIARQLLTGGKELHQRLKRYQEVKITGAGENSLVIKHSVRFQTERICSLRRATAAAASWCLKRQSGTQFTTTIDNVLIVNSLARAHGIPEDTPLYYVYNVGLEFMVTSYPGLTAALLCWRSLNRIKLMGMPEKEEGQDYRQSSVYYEQLASEAKVSIDDYYKSLLSDEQTMDAIEILKKCIPKDRAAKHTVARIHHEDMFSRRGDV